MKFIKLLLPFLFISVLLYAQPSLIRTDLIPNSPTATSIVRYGASSVNLANGTPSLSIPLFNMQGNDLSVPISLNYVYEGFKPTQTPGWAGLGWSVNAGGVITRTIRGIIDNTLTSGSNYKDPAVQLEVNNITHDQDFLKYSYNAFYDTEVDSYNFSFDGYSGKFVKYNDKFYVIPNQKLKITGGESGFTITTENGTVYTFSDFETSSPKGSSGTPYNIPSHKSAWYLSGIENASGTEKIVFLYNSEGTISQSGVYSQTYKKIDNLSASMSSTLYPATTSLPTKVTSLRLSQIISEKYTVNFYAGELRTDVNQSEGGDARALENIEVYDNTGTFLKAFKFNTGYMGAHLKLNSLYEYPSTYDTTKRLKYVFEYNESSGGVSVKNTAAVDHYGFSTGGQFGTTLLPGYIYPGGPSRTPNVMAIEGSLSKITYPTGGNTQFSYENNVRNNGFNYQQVPREEEARAERTNTSTTNEIGSGVDEPFVLSTAQTISITVYRVPKSVSGDGIAKNDVDDFVIFSGSEEVFTGRIVSESENNGKTFTTTLPAGSYYLSTTCDSKENSIIAVASYTSASSAPDPGLPSSGIRVSKVVHEPVIGLPTQTLYKYTDDNGFSTGVGPDPNYTTTFFTDIIVPSSNIPEEISSTNYTSVIAENELTSVPHYYTSVLELKISGTDTLFTRNNYESYNLIFAGIKPVKTIQYKQTPEGRDTLSTKEYVYEKVSDSLFNLLKIRQTMKVTFTGGSYVGALEEFEAHTETIYQKWLYTKSIKEVSYEGSDSLVTVTNNYYNTTDTRNLTRSTSTTSDGKLLVTRFKYPEDYTSGVSGTFTAAHVLAPAWEQQTWKKTGPDSVLVAANITEFSSTLFKPVKQYAMATLGVTAMNNEGTSSGKYSYLLSDSRYQERAAYAYDAAGRLISQQLTAGSPTSYQWGYTANKTYETDYGQMRYPIAEAKNALPTEFYTENFEQHGSATAGTSHTGLKYYSGDFYVSWAIPNGRSYILSYWYLDSGLWKYQEQSYSGPTTLSLGSAIDDVCIYPKDALVSSFTYSPGGLLASQTDTKGLTAYFEYDEFLRLKFVKDQHGNIVKANTYHFKN